MVRTIRRRYFGIFAVLAAISLLCALDDPGAAVAQEQPEEEQLLDQLGDARVYRNDATGKVSLIGATSKQEAIDRPAGLPANASPVVAARAHLSKYGALFGLRNQAQELRSEGADDAGQGRSVVHFQQVHQDVPVLGGELNVQLTDANELLVANGEVLPGVSLDTNPGVSTAEARETALAKIARDRELDAAGLDVTDPELWIYDPTLLGGPGQPVPKLVWRMEVTPSGHDYFNELVLVDAQTGSVVLNFDQTPHARNRLTYDSMHTNTVPNRLACDESNPCTDPSLDKDVRDVHGYAGEAYDFYATNHGHDSMDNAGMTLISHVNYCSETSCPYTNAFWIHEGVNKGQMVYGDTWAVDDLVGHELTHGVTYYESNLMYYYESGAINESFSDVWGEFIDLANNTSGTDTEITRWQLYEDVPNRAPLRDMQDPPLKDDPDRTQSPLYYVGEGDNGGVHTNSGINNKAAYLMTDGGTFNNVTVTGLGVTKVAKIYYEVQANLLTAASDYNDLYGALQQACTNLTGTSGITAADCQEVKDAADATEMNITVGGPDATDPDTTITSQPTNPTNSTTASFSFTSTETGSTFECSKDNQTWAACTSPYNYSSTPLPNGSYNFYVRAKDAAGNVDQTPANYTWTVDDTAPSCTKTGTSNAETISGTSGDDVICAGGGNDTVNGLGGNDTLKGEDGNDTLIGGTGNDALDGGPGTDTASYAPSLTAVTASLATNAATGEGSDTFVALESLLGSSKADALTGSNTANNLTGGGAGDALKGGGGNDQVIGSVGADNLAGEDGNDAVNSKDGTKGNDSLDGGAGTDTKVTDAKEKSIVGFP